MQVLTPVPVPRSSFPAPPMPLKLHHANGRNLAQRMTLRDAGNEQFEVGLIDTIDRHPMLARYQDEALCGSAQIGDHGTAVVWVNIDELALAANKLHEGAIKPSRHRAVAPSGGVPHEFI